MTSPPESACVVSNPLKIAGVVIRNAAAILALVLAVACAEHVPLSLPAVGPVAPVAARKGPSADADAPPSGVLVVYSDTVPVAKDRNPPVYAHSGYVIRKASGQLLERVDNREAAVDPAPAEVSLPAGLYQVQARCANLGKVLVPVVISPDRRTVLYLDASGMPAKEASGLADPVRLPDGRVVGARAARAAKP